MTEIPDEFSDFAKKKQKELLVNVLSSSAAAVVLANGISLVCGDASADVLADSVMAQLPLLMLAAGASVLAK